MARPMNFPRRLAMIAALPLAACSMDSNPARGEAMLDNSGEHPTTALSTAPFIITEIANFKQPWAMTFLAETPLALISQKGGQLLLWEEGGEVREVSGVPNVAAGGQGGLGDIIALGAAKDDGAFPVALSWVEAGEGGYRSVVATATINPSAGAALNDLKIIWRQSPFVSGRGHFGHRLALAPDGQHLFISSGERQKFDPAQDMTANLGKIVRIRLDGSAPTDNPFANKGGVAAQIWTSGHRNPLGMVFDDQGRLWSHEMGPAGGDEVNLIERAANYGYPIVSNGDHYDGRDIPDHPTRAEFQPPALWWNPSISPAGLTFHNGRDFKNWGPSLLMGALGGESLIRIALKDGKASKAERWNMGARIREVETRSDGSIWVLTDGDEGKLLRLTAK